MFFMLLALPIGLKAQAEPDFSSFFSGESKLVVQALDSSFVILTQDYVLVQKTGGPKAKRYGKGADAFFGRQLRVGIIAEGKLYIEQTMNMPWLGDQDVDAFLDSLKPQLSDAHFRHVRNPALTALNPAPTYGIGKTLIVAMPIPVGMQKVAQAPLSLPVRIMPPPKSGRLLVVYHDDDAEVWESALDYAVERFEVSNWNDNGVADATLPEIAAEIVGGAFFEEAIQNGRIQYKLAAMLVFRDGRWYLVSLTATSNALDSKLLTPLGPKK